VKKLAKVLIVVPVLILLWSYASEFLAVDACLDAGNVYDFAQGLCRSDVRHLPYVRYSERHLWLLLSAAVPIVTGIITLLAKRFYGAGGLER
jgi:hypothetical protein